MRMVIVVLFVGSVLGCDDRPPPCHPEGNGPGTVVGPTPTPPWGPGGPGDPPDYSDPPETYSKNDEGEVCLCSPYQSGCTTDPDGTAGEEGGSAAPSDETGSVSPSAPRKCEAACRAGHARFSLYCQNPDLVPPEIRGTCERNAEIAAGNCRSMRPDRGCDSPCSVLHAVFEMFCRDHAPQEKKRNCWATAPLVDDACRAMAR
jgi:hypothetical protein